MPTLYDQYSLANSSEIPKYIGSAIPEIQKVADTLQERYDVGQQQADMLDQAVKNSTASSFDQPQLSKLKDEYRQKLKDYAQKGDYENMWRNVAMDSRDFVNKYRTFAENSKRLGEYQEELNKQVDAGKLTPEMVKAKMAQVADTYQGLQYNPETGQYGNLFQGDQMAHYVDMPKKINEWLQNSHAVERGSEVKQINGDYYVTKGGTSKKLPWNSVYDKNGNVVQEGVQDIIKTGMASDPEVQAYYHQERQLAPYYSGISSKLSDSRANDFIQASSTLRSATDQYLQRGYSASAALREAIGDLHVNNLENAALQHGRKGVIDESTSKYETEFNPIGAERGKKAIEDQDIPLSAQIWQPDRSLAFDPGKLDSHIDELNTKAGNTQQDMATWARDIGLRKVGNNFLDKDGNNVNFDYQKKLDMAKQDAQAAKDLQAFKDKAKADAKFTITPELQKQAQKAYDDAGGQYDGANAFATREGAKIGNITREQFQQNAFDDVLKNSPGYQRYKDQLDKYSKSNQLVGIQRFDSKVLNTTAEETFKNLALNLDAKGIKFGALGLEWGTGPNAGTGLEADDYKKIRDDAKFVGVGIDTDGQYKYFYKVGKLDKNSKGKDTGEEMIVKMPALAGTSEALIAHGQIGQTQQNLTQAISNVPGTGEVDLGGGKSVHVEKAPDGSYELSFPLDNGKVMKVPTNGRAEAVNYIITALQNASKRK